MFSRMVFAMQTDWTWKDLFDEHFWKEVWRRFSRSFRMVLRLTIFFVVIHQFFLFGIIPSESMYPTLQVKDFVLYKKTSAIERGDIVLFRHPLNEEEIMVKRAIGLPGDTVEIKDGHIYVNDEVWKADYVQAKPMFEYEKATVPDNHYFVLGDNINASEDSVSFGFVKQENIMGKAVAILLPFQRFHIFP